MALPQGPFYQALGKKIRTARTHAGVSQEGLSTAIGFSRTSITNIEKGRQPVYVHTLLRISEVLGADFQTLLPELQPHANLEMHLKGLDPEKTLWVQKIIAPPQLAMEDNNVSKIFAREKESKR